MLIYQQYISMKPVCEQTGIRIDKDTEILIYQQYISMIKVTSFSIETTVTEQKQ